MATGSDTIPETIVLLAGLLESELELLPTENPDHKRVTIYNQKWRLPPLDGVFISVSIVYQRPFGLAKREVDDPDNPGAMLEEQIVSVQEAFQIDIFSRDDSARTRKEEVVFALNSTGAQQLAEKWAFKIGNVPPSFVDLSSVEASARLNRYAISFNVLRAKTRVRRIEAFTIFQNPPRGILINP